MPAASEAVAPKAAGMRQVARNTAFLLAGEAGVKVLSFGFTVLIVRRLGVEGFGRFSAAVAFVGIFAILTDLGTTTLSLREMARAPERAAVLATRLMALRLFLSLPVVLGIPWLAARLGEPPAMVSAIVVASLGLVIHACVGPIQSLLLTAERLDVVSMAHVVNQLVFLAVGAPLLFLGGGFVGLLAAQLVAQVIAGMVSARAAYRHLGFRPTGPAWSGWWRLLRGGFPFLIGQVSDVISNRFAIAFIFFALSETHVGWYSVSSGLVMMVLPLAQSLGLAIFPMLVRQYDGDGRAVAETVQRSLRYLLLASLPIAVGGCLLAEPIVTVLYTSAFAPSAPLLRLLVWTLPALFAIEVVGRVAFIQHRENAMARIYLAGAVLGAVLIVVLVETVGLTGAALAVVLTRLYLLAAMVRLVRTDLVLGSAGSVARIAVSAALMGLGVWWFSAVLAQEPIPPALALGLAIGAGAGLYAGIVLALGAVSLSERRLLLGAAATAFRRLSRA